MMCKDLKLPICGNCESSYSTSDCWIVEVRKRIASTKRGEVQNILRMLTYWHNMYSPYICAAIRQYYPQHIPLMEKILVLR